ncbi:MAG TPA: chloride channel protein, partial [Bacteroidia bacterium]|nr:chloride channel protein [Bacteroidia bacterium]
LRHISNRNFLLILSIFIGILAGLASAVLKMSAAKIEYFLGYIGKNESAYLFFLPLVGVLLAVLYVQIFRKGKIGVGISGILYTIHKKHSKIEKDKMYSHMITSALTVGFGGSVGLEAPIVVTGAALGSNTAKAFNLHYKERTLLLACGAAAGIGAIFNSPIAGVLFAVEVLLSEFSIPAFIPLLISAATASVVSQLIDKSKLFYLVTSSWDFKAIPFYIVLGLLTGILSVYITRTIAITEEYFKAKKRPYQNVIIGGTLLSILIFIFPPLYGEGYRIVELLLEGKGNQLLQHTFFAGDTNQWTIVIIAACIVLVKPFATALTIGAGGNGGIFAPSLFIGAVLGFVFAHTVNLLGFYNITEANFIVVAMAGILSGVIHIPLTAIFLIAEITGGYILLVPLMIVSAISYFIIRYFEPYSIYLKQLARKGHLPSQADKDKLVLNKMHIEELIEKDFLTISGEATLGELVHAISHSKRNIFPVIDENSLFEGVVLLDHVREQMFQTEKYDRVFVKDIMFHPPASIDIKEKMSSVMHKFEESNSWNLPVLDEGVYVGFISKSAVFTKYRELLLRQAKMAEKSSLSL